MHFLSLAFAMSAAAVALDSTKRRSDRVLQTNLVSGRAVPVLEGSMDPTTSDLANTPEAVDLLAQSPIPIPTPNPGPDPNLDQTIPLAFNEVPYPDFLDEICKYPKQLGCCWVQNGRRFCDYFSTIQSEECANHQNWRCCDKIDRNNFIGINCKRFEVKEPAPKKDEQQQQQQNQLEQEPPPELEQSFPLDNPDSPDWLNRILFPGAADQLWQNQ